LCNYRYGSIWLVNFDPSVGTEINKTRPALIISPTDFNQVRSKVTLLPISSSIVKAKTIKPLVVTIKSTTANGLSVDSIVVAIEPNTFDKKRLIKYLGQLEKNLIEQVDDIFHSYFTFE
jgi:mRNA interferase MazF